MSDTVTNKKTARRRPPRFELIAGAVCLDFINTLDDRFSSEPKELLESYLDLARFGEDAGILAESTVDRLFTRSQISPEPARKTLKTAIQMREAMFAVFTAIAKKTPPPALPLMIVNQCIQAAAQHARLVPVPRAPTGSKSAQASGPFEWRFDALPSTFEDPLWPIAHSAAELLTSDKLPYIRMCASKTCQWFFLDTSKNHRRRWCDMTQCGNRAKVQRFYERRSKVK